MFPSISSFLSLFPILPSLDDGTISPILGMKFSQLFRATERPQLPHPGFVPSWGRVSRGFDPSVGQRGWQAEQILKGFGQWPPKDGEVFVMQIDQDSPPPPGKFPRDMRATDFMRQKATWIQNQQKLQAYVTQYTGQTVVFQARKTLGQIELVELNPKGPLPSSSHPGQLDPAGQASCTGGVCGMAWPRSGVVPYMAKGGGGVFSPVNDVLVRVARDVNFDGGIDEEESAKSADSHGIAVQIHPGFPGNPRSVGCQTLPPEHFATLQRLLAESGVETFKYVLVKRSNDLSGPRPW